MSEPGEASQKRPRLNETSSNVVTLLDYGAGNVHSVVNAILKLGYSVRMVQEPDDIRTAERLVFPGVGAFGPCVAALHAKGYFEPLKAFLEEDKPFLGICLGMQTLFEASEESPGIEGLKLLPGTVRRFPKGSLAVPHIAWTGVAPICADSWPLASDASARCYFVHSYRVEMPQGPAPWALAVSEYGERFVCAVRRGRCVATQFHPEKSGQQGLEILKTWLRGSEAALEPRSLDASLPPVPPVPLVPLAPARRIIACLDVRSNDEGDLVVTKGDQYDCRQASEASASRGQVRNHGKPVALAERYYEEGADEITFLNITAFRDIVLQDQPMLQVLRSAAERVFVPLTVGGGIRATSEYSALEVADAYFRAGADKVSIGSEAVQAAQAYYAAGKKLSGDTAIEMISAKYGCQAVVVSIDPRRVYVSEPSSTQHSCVELGGSPHGPKGETWAWYCCTLKGGRENSDVDVVQLAVAVEALGAGELLLNCIDRDGQGSGYELELILQVKAACSLPVIASSGAGCPRHFAEALETGADAALAAGIFHRSEVPLLEVKRYLEKEGIPVRI